MLKFICRSLYTHKFLKTFIIFVYFPKKKKSLKKVYLNNVGPYVVSIHAYFFKKEIHSYLFFNNGN